MEPRFWWSLLLKDWIFFSFLACLCLSISKIQSWCVSLSRGYSRWEKDSILVISIKFFSFSIY
jgi:hypothetical protein